MLNIVIFGAPGSGKAVSYTHLDVYKRQSEGWSIGRTVIVPFW